MTYDPKVESDALAKLFEDRLGLKGRGLAAKLRSGRRLIPRWVRRSAQKIVDAEGLAAHPKLVRQVDEPVLRQAYRTCETWLKTVDMSERRKTAMLRFLAQISFNLILIAVAFLVTVRLAGLM